METVVRTCTQCGRPLPPTKRADAMYCGDACKTAAYEQRQRRARVQLLDSEVHDAGQDSREELTDRLRSAVAEAVQETKLVAVIAAEARHNWRASAWLLSRLYPDRWGERGRDVPVGFEGELDEFTFVDELAARRRARPPQR